MKILLIHNPSAGDRSQPSDDQLIELIRGAGHRVNYRSSKAKKWKQSLDKACDVIAVAGGDGTVGKVARELAGSRTPIAILPVGTANNVARAMGLAGKTLEQLVLGWKTGRRINFDVGEAQGPWGSTFFIEGFGVGLFAAAIAGITPPGKLEPAVSWCREDEIKAVLRGLKERLEIYRPRKLKVRLDDQDLSGEYVLLEALNIRYIGPNLDLVPGADTNDGLIDVVVLARGEEAKLKKYLSDCITRKNAKADLTVHRGRHLHIECDSFPIHIDDKHWPKADDRKPARRNAIDISVSSHALVFLCPQKNQQRSPRLIAA